MISYTKSLLPYCAAAAVLYTFFTLQPAHGAHISSITQPDIMQTLHSWAGTPTLIKEYTGNRFDALVHKRTIFFENGQVVQEQAFDDSGAIKTQTIYQYAENGSITEIIGLDAAGMQIWKYTYSYDEQGRLIEETSLGVDNTVEWIKHTQYRDSERMIERQSVQHNGEVTASESYAYDTYGNITESITLYGNGKLLKRTVSDYADDGQHLADTHYDSSGIYETETYVYDSGLLTCITKTDAAGQIKGTTEFAYDGTNRVAVRTERNPDNSIRTRRQFIYDLQGNCILQRDELQQTYALFDITYAIG